MTSFLGKVERKVLGALLILSNDNMEVKTSTRELATTMGYKASGGALTFALHSLEMKNFISKENDIYKVLL